MTKGQQAMAHAMIFPEADTAYPGKKSREGKLLETKSFSGARLSQARTVLAAAPDLARGVLNGSEPLDKAYETVREPALSCALDTQGLLSARPAV